MRTLWHCVAVSQQLSQGASAREFAGLERFNMQLLRRLQLVFANQAIDVSLIALVNSSGIGRGQIVCDPWRVADLQ